MAVRLLVGDTVVRHRTATARSRAPKARWVVHTTSCAYAPGCAPLADLVAALGEPGVLGRLRLGLLVRCVTCRPTLVEVVAE